jgi:putative ubiquitin-RnfH superfamily antitoxin RatB of RatAB toxin-antitoxin module
MVLFPSPAKETFLAHSPADEAMPFAVEVAYALPDRQTVLRMQVAPGTTLEQAIASSGILVLHPEIDLTMHKTGIFGQRKPLLTVLAPNDRVEIYRALLADPKEARRQRVTENRRKTRSPFSKTRIQNPE